MGKSLVYFLEMINLLKILIPDDLKVLRKSQMLIKIKKIKFKLENKTILRLGAILNKKNKIKI